MRLQVILHGGPFDMDIMGVDKKDDDWPVEIRLAFCSDSHNKLVQAYQYRRHDVDDKGTIFFGSYKFTHSFESKATLIEYWV